MRLVLADFGGVDEFEAFDAVILAAFLERGKLGLFVRIGGDHQLAAVTERHVVPFAEFVSQAIAFDAQTRL